MVDEASHNVEVELAKRINEVRWLRHDLQVHSVDIVCGWLEHVGDDLVVDGRANLVGTRDRRWDDVGPQFLEQLCVNGAWVDQRL